MESGEPPVDDRSAEGSKPTADDGARGAPPISVASNACTTNEVEACASKGEVEGRKADPLAVDHRGGEEGADTTSPSPYVEEVQGLPKDASLQIPLTCKAPGSGSARARPYISHPDLRTRVVDLLLEGVYPSKAAKILKVTPQLVKHHVDRAVEDGEIVYVVGSYPKRYKKGPKYGSVVYKYRKRRRSPQFVNPEACVHLGNGSSYRIKVLKEGDLHSIKTRAWAYDEPAEFLPLFPQGLKGKVGQKHYSGCLPIPADIVGREGVTATLVFYPTPNPKASGGRLEISPPKMFLNLEQLTAIPPGENPFKPVFDHVLNFLSRYASWSFGKDLYIDNEVHYAFSRSMVDPLFPLLMDNPAVHLLRRGERESDHPLFRDLSVPEGELETTDLRMAQDLLALLTRAYRERTRRR